MSVAQSAPNSNLAPVRKPLFTLVLEIVPACGTAHTKANSKPTAHTRNVLRILPRRWFDFMRSIG
jgi:hypothetical protein